MMNGSPLECEVGRIADVVIIEVKIFGINDCGEIYTMGALYQLRFGARVRNARFSPRYGTRLNILFSNLLRRTPVRYSG